MKRKSARMIFRTRTEIDPMRMARDEEEGE